MGGGTAWNVYSVCRNEQIKKCFILLVEIWNFRSFCKKKVRIQSVIREINFWMYNFTVGCRIFFFSHPSWRALNEKSYLITSRLLSSDNRDVLRKDWRLTEVDCTLYIHYMEFSLSQIPAHNMWLVRHKILDPKPVPSLWVHRRLWLSKREGEDNEYWNGNRIKIYIWHKLLFLSKKLSSLQN